MLYSYEMIFDALMKFHAAAATSIPQDVFISDIQILDSQSSFVPNVLYIMLGSELCSCASGSLPTDILCILDASLPDQFRQSSECRIIVIPTYVPPQIILQELKQKMKYEYDKRLRQNYEELFHTLSKKDAVQAVTEAASRFLDNPVVIVDSSYRHLASAVDYSRMNLHSDTDNPLFLLSINNLHSSGLDQKSIDFLKTTQRYKQNIQSTAPHIADKDSVLYDGFRAPHSYIDCGLRIGGVFVGYICIADAYHPFDEHDLEYCAQFARFITMALSRDKSFVHEHGLQYEILLSEIISGQSQDNLQTRLRLKNISKELKKEIRVVAIHKAESMESKVAIRLIRQSTVRNFFTSCISFVHGETIVLLVSGNSTKELSSEIATNELFLDFLESNHMYAGVSESFSDLIKLQKYYSQSITAIEFGTKLNHSVRTFFYYDYAFYHMAELILRNHTLNDFCHPLIIQLLESKDERDFELLKTLYVWFRSGKNAAIVSQVLGIHRSTFFYRLNKFKERLDENPEDGETLFHLMFSFELIYFAAIQNSDQKLAWIRELPAFQTGQGAN